MEVQNTFPEELFREILSRLTVRQLLKLRCVSKRWCFIIDKCSFMLQQYKVQYAILSKERNIPLFCDKPSVFGHEEDPVEFYLLSKKLENNILCLTPDLSRDSSPHFSDKPDLFNSLFCAGVVNGVVLLRWEGEYLGLWNPATREFKAIPHPRPNQPDTVQENIASFQGLGFDSKTNDFKVVRSIHWMMKKEPDWDRKYIYETYSLRANAWKNVEIPCPSLCIHETVTDGYYNGVQYWVANELDDSFNTRQFWMLSFNFSTDVLKLCDPPPRVRGDMPKWEYCVGKYKDSLAAIFTGRNVDDHVCHFDIWIASKFDEDDPAIPVYWDHLFTIGPVPSFDGLWFHTFLLDDDMLLTIEGGDIANTSLGGYECAFYTPTTRTFKRLGVGLGSCLRYVESLFSFSKYKS